VKYVRYEDGSHTPQWGQIEDEYVAELSNNPLHSHTQTGSRRLLTDVRLLAPAENPSKIVCFGKNYRAHVREMGWEVPHEPVMFLKPPSAVIGPDEPIVLPKASNHIEPEGELAVIIGQTGKNIPVEDAIKHVFGFTIANDISARDLMASDGQWARAKGYDSFLPLGPHIQTGLDPNALQISTTLDGKECQRGITSDMIRTVPELISLCSSTLTLNVGDIILTGSPAGRARLVAGQTVQITIDEIGTLRNEVQSQQSH
jgi:2-keto-4-pentenoate hydratase/2-oxohepta-3-ene-1,7-dioic acid hydratase in catechol pathway